MILTTADIIVRRSLLERGLPIHWYAELLFHTTACIRELAIDTLKIINTVQLSVDEFGSALLPDDFVDDIGVSSSTGGRLNSIPHQNNINPIRSHNATTGAIEVLSLSEREQSLYASAFWGGANYGWFWNVDAYGGFTGALFGANGGTLRGYSIIREQRRIQMSGGFENGGIVLMYVSDGQSIDNATQIDIKAINCIQRFNDWKMSAGATNMYSPEGTTFFKSKKNLKARLSDLTTEDVKQTLRQNYTATIKN